MESCHCQDTKDISFAFAGLAALVSCLMCEIISGLTIEILPGLPAIIYWKVSFYFSCGVIGLYMILRGVVYCKQYEALAFTMLYMFGQMCIGLTYIVSAQLAYSIFGCDDAWNGSCWAKGFGMSIAFMSIIFAFTYLIFYFRRKCNEATIATHQFHALAQSGEPV